MQIGSTIKSLRVQKGISQKDLAARVGITASYLSLVENDIKQPNMGTVVKISKAIGIPAEVLFFLSLDKSKLPKNKQEAFATLVEPIKSLVNQIFIVG